MERRTMLQYHWPSAYRRTTTAKLSLISDFGHGCIPRLSYYTSTHPSYLPYGFCCISSIIITVCTSLRMLLLPSTDLAAVERC